jgi:tRNA(Ile)-lysidine synthase
VRRGIVVRPLLGLRRDVVRAACPRLPGLGLPWHDPSNDAAVPGAEALLRARVRGEVLPALVDVLGAAAVASLARSADLLREDADALDAWAERETVAMAGQQGGPVGPVEVALDPLVTLPAAVRRRVLRRLAVRAGARSLSLAHTRALEGLVLSAPGHGPVALPGPVTAARTTGTDGCGRLTLAVDDPPREDRHGRP